MSTLLSTLRPRAPVPPPSARLNSTLAQLHRETAMGRPGSVAHRRPAAVRAHGSLLTPSLLCARLAHQRTFRGHRSAVYCIVYDKAGRYIVTGSDDRLVKIWSTASGYLLCTCRGHTGDITDLSVNADDTLLASGSNDNRVCVWHLSTERTGDKALGALAGVCKGHHQELAEINFNPVVPNLLLTASFDGTARLWNVEALHKGAVICRPTPGGPREAPAAAAGGDARATSGGAADTPERTRGGASGEAGPSGTVGVSPGGGAAALSAAEMQARV